MADELDDCIAVRLSSDEAAVLADLPVEGESRRQFLVQMSACAVGVLAIQLMAEQELLANVAPSSGALFAPLAEENPLTVNLVVNGARQSVTLDSRVTLLDTLRERLDLTG